jgi:hypothetical protein
MGGLVLAAILAGSTVSVAIGSRGAAPPLGQYIVVLKPGGPIGLQRSPLRALSAATSLCNTGMRLAASP